MNSTQLEIGAYAYSTFRPNALDILVFRLVLQGSRAFSRSASRAQRTLSRQASRMPGRASGGMAAPAPSLVVLQSGTASVGSVGGGGAAASASTTTVGGGGADSEPTTPRRGRIWQPLTSPIPEGVASSQGDFEGEEEEAAGAAAATEFRDAGEDVVLPERAESPQGLAAVATEGSLAPPEADLSEGTAAALTAAAAAAVTAVKASPPVPVAPARHAGEEPITASGSVHWSQGVSDSQPRSIPLHVHHCISAVRPAAAEAAVLETDAEGTAAQQPQRRGPGRHLSFSAAHPSVAVAATSPRAWEEPAGHTAQGAVSSEGEEMEEAEGSCQELQPPDLGFRVFVVVHELQVGGPESSFPWRKRDRPIDVQKQCSRACITASPSVPLTRLGLGLRACPTDPHHGRRRRRQSRHQRRGAILPPAVPRVPEAPGGPAVRPGAGRRGAGAPQLSDQLGRHERRLCTGTGRTVEHTATRYPL